MLPEFQRVYPSIQKMIDEFINARMRVYGYFNDERIETKEIPEGRGFESIYEDGFQHQTELKKLEYSININMKELLQDEGHVWTILDKIALDRAKKEDELMIESINQLTEKTGNVMTRKGGKFTPEDFLKTLSSIRIEFDKEGNPNLPQILAGSDLFKEISEAQEKIHETPELKKRYNEILLRKKKDWDDRESNRRLVG